MDCNTLHRKNSLDRVGNKLILVFWIIYQYFYKSYWQINYCEYNPFVKIYSLSPLMSVASTTKTKIFTTVVLSFVAALSVLPTWASTTPGIVPISTVSPVVSTQWNQSNQDLWELRVKLKQRFSWISSEVRSLLNWTPVTTIFSTGTVLVGTSIRTIDVSQGIWVNPTVSRQDFFVDIANDPYKTYINRLAAYGVLASTQKFYPQNYFRIEDFMTVFSKLYKKSIPQNIFKIASPDGIMTKWMLQQIMYELPDVEKIDIDGNLYDKLIRAEWAYYLVRMFDVPALETNGQSLPSMGDAFTDIANNPFADDINTLASLGVLNTWNPKFYPDNYLRHYDFVILFINALLTSQNESLPIASLNFPYADVDSTSSYIPQLIYATDRGLIDYITTSKGGQLFFGPNDFITKHETYQILAKATNVKYIYNEQQADQEQISRAELAKLLVDSFQFQPKHLSSDTLSWTILNTGEMSVLVKLKTLLSML